MFDWTKVSLQKATMNNFDYAPFILSSSGNSKFVSSFLWKFVWIVVMVHRYHFVATPQLSQPKQDF